MPKWTLRTGKKQKRGHDWPKAVALGETKCFRQKVLCFLLVWQKLQQCDRYGETACYGAFEFGFFCTDKQLLIGPSVAC